MAAEVLASGGFRVDVFDAMPSVGRKFLLAGRGGLNLTHAEAPEIFMTRYAERHHELAKLMQNFKGSDLRAWAEGLGIETFVGTSQRVFPKEMKAAPLLRAWLHRLRASGVHFHMRHRWVGWDKSGALCFTVDGKEVLTQQPESSQESCIKVKANVCIMALGGASWRKLGSDGAWMPWLHEKGVELASLKAANCGFDLESGWSEHLRTRFAGHPIKPVVLSFTDSKGRSFSRQGEFVVTDTGIEGSLVYAA